MPINMIVWITGLSGAGKTTLALDLLPKMPKPCLLLDGDSMREALQLIATGYDRDSRLKLALTYSRLCKMLAEQGTNIVCSTISMFHEVHAWNRNNLPDYIEVYLDMPECVRKERDNKCVYNKSDVMGAQLEPETPRNPDLVISDYKKSPADIADDIVTFLGLYS